MEIYSFVVVVSCFKTKEGIKQTNIKSSINIKLVLVISENNFVTYS